MVSVPDKHRDNQVIKFLDVEPNVLTTDWIKLCLSYYAMAIGIFCLHKNNN